MGGGARRPAFAEGTRRLALGPHTGWRGSPKGEGKERSFFLWVGATSAQTCSDLRVPPCATPRPPSPSPQGASSFSEKGGGHSASLPRQPAALRWPVSGKTPGICRGLASAACARGSGVIEEERPGVGGGDVKG